MHEPEEVHHSRCSVAVLLGNGDLHDIGAGDLGVDHSHVLVVAHNRGLEVAHNHGLVVAHSLDVEDILPVDNLALLEVDKMLADTQEEDILVASVQVEDTLDGHLAELQSMGLDNVGRVILIWICALQVICARETSCCCFVSWRCCCCLALSAHLSAWLCSHPLLEPSSTTLQSLTCPRHLC